MADPQKYRELAARVRRDAEKVESPVIKRQMLEIADQYDQLAKSVAASRGKDPQ
jgi:hypothetical protein